MVNTTRLSFDGHAEIQGVSSSKQNPLIYVFLRSDLQSHPTFCTSSHRIILRSVTNLEAGRPEKLGFDYWMTRDLSFPAAPRPSPAHTVPHPVDSLRSFLGDISEGA